jgi:hypothetical protein
VLHEAAINGHGVGVLLLGSGGDSASAAKPFQVEEVTISEGQAAYKSGALTSTQLVEAAAR